MAELRLGPRRGDHVPVMITAGNGPAFIFHEPEEYATLWRGVDAEATEALENDDG